MQTETKKKDREPLIQISKRPAMVWWKSYSIRAGALLAAFLLCVILASLLTKKNLFELFKRMIVYPFCVDKKGSTVFLSDKLWDLLKELALLLCVALALTPAFKMRFWNIGAEGQILMGAYGCYIVLRFLTGKVPTPILYILMVAASLLFGAVWGAIPAIFKAFFGTNETLFTLMMNYVAACLIEFSILYFKWGATPKMNYTGMINRKGEYKHVGWLPEIFGQKYLMIVLIVAVLTVLLYIYLRYSKHGYELSVVGESEKTAKYIGINVKKVIIRTMILSGALCGIAGLIVVSGTDHALKMDSSGGRGFTAIMVTWLAHFNPAYMALTSFLIVFVQRGAKELSSAYAQISDSFADVLVGLILFFIIGCEFFINYRVRIHLPRKRKEEIEE